MRKFVPCLNVPQHDKIWNQSRSWFKENLQHRRNRFDSPLQLKALFSVSFTLVKVRLRANGNMLPTIKEHLWMIREGTDLLKYFDDQWESEE